MLMKGLVITNYGFEEECSKEIVRITKKATNCEKTAVIFETDDVSDFIKVVYTSQSAIKVLCLLGSFTFKSEKDILDGVKKINFDDQFDDDQKFMVRVKRNTSIIESAKNLEAEIGEIIKGEADLKNPDIEFYCYFYENTAYIGIDMSFIDLSKRDYKVFCGSNSLKSTICFSMLSLAGYDPKKTILDPFSSDGTFGIEAAFFATKKPVQFYNREKFGFHRLNLFKGIDIVKCFDELDKLQKEIPLHIFISDYVMKGVVAARKNAKIAGVLDMINFSRVDMDWLDIKYGKNSTDIIIGRPPVQSSGVSKNHAEKFYTSFFKRAHQILKESGKIVFIVVHEKLILDYAIVAGFKVDKTLDTKQGDMDLKVLVMSKS